MRVRQNLISCFSPSKGDFVTTKALWSPNHLPFLPRLQQIIFSLLPPASHGIKSIVQFSFGFSFLPLIRSSAFLFSLRITKMSSQGKKGFSALQLLFLLFICFAFYYLVFADIPGHACGIQRLWLFPFFLNKTCWLKKKKKSVSSERFIDLFFFKRVRDLIRHLYKHTHIHNDIHIYIAIYMHAHTNMHILIHTHKCKYIFASVNLDMRGSLQNSTKHANVLLLWATTELIVLRLIILSRKINSPYLPSLP